MKSNYPCRQAVLDWVATDADAEIFQAGGARHRYSWSNHTRLLHCPASSSNDLATVMSPAQADFNRKIAASKDQGASQHLARGVEWLKQSDYKKALEEFNLGLKRDPQHPCSTFSQLTAIRRWRAAETLISSTLPRSLPTGLEFNPSMRAAAVQLGYIALDRRDWRGAQNDFSLALEINPNEPRSDLPLWPMLHIYAGDLATAQAMIRRLPEDAQESPEILRTPRDHRRGDRR